MKLVRSKFATGFLILILVVGFLGIQSPVQAADPIEIDSCQDLQNIDQDLSADYIITSDFSCAQATRTTSGSLYNSGAGFSPIGLSEATAFTGTLNGQNHIIDGLYINHNGNYAALFYITGAGQIENLKLTNETIIGIGYVGGLVGYNSGTTINNVTVNVDITASSTRVGGLVGSSRANITNSRATGSITSSVGMLGGFVGYKGGGTISGSSANVNITLTGDDLDQVGGFVGYDHSGDINTSHATGSVTAPTSTNVGGFVGVLDNGATIDTSYATGAVNGGSGVGGFVGAIVASGVISRSFATGDVNSVDGSAGGFVGYTSDFGDGNNSNISNSYANGNVTGEAQGYIGGFLGWGNGGTLINNYATGNAFGWISVGGFAGNNGNTINHSYSSGTASGNFGVGGFIGTDWGQILGVQFNYSYGEVVSIGLEPSAIGGFVGNGADGWDYADSNNWWYGTGSAIGAGSATNPNIANSLVNLRTNGTADFDFDEWETTTGDPTLYDMPDLAADSLSPEFENLPESNVLINITEGQTITTNPYTIEVYPTSPKGIFYVDFYIDDIRICSEDMTNADGVYTCQWDTEEYHSDIKIYAYDDDLNRTEALERTTTVGLIELPDEPIVNHDSNEDKEETTIGTTSTIIELPQTGADLIFQNIFKNL